MDALNKHMMYVAEVCRVLGMSYGLEKTEMQQLELAASYHDIGKKQINPKLFNRKRKLTKQEYEIVKTHSAIGAEMLRTCQFEEDIILAVRYHHEWWNGQGYPEGLKEEEIPLFARIIAVADAYTAMTTDRPYRKALTSFQALVELLRCSGTQFDPGIVKLLLGICKEHGISDYTELLTR